METKKRSENKSAHIVTKHAWRGETEWFVVDDKDFKILKRACKNLDKKLEQIEAMTGFGREKALMRNVARMELRLLVVQVLIPLKISTKTWENLKNEIELVLLTNKGAKSWKF